MYMWQVRPQDNTGYLLVDIIKDNKFIIIDTSYWRGDTFYLVGQVIDWITDFNPLIKNNILVPLFEPNDLLRVMING